MKRGNINVVIFLVFFILFITRVSAYSGVTPALYEIDFEPNSVQEFNFRFMFGEGVEAEIYSTGDFSEFVKLDKTTLFGGGTVKATVSFPSDYDKAGTRRLLIGARQVADKVGEGVSLAFNVQGVIKVKVPYPGEYVEANLQGHNANAGEPVNFELNVDNLGKQNVYVTPVLKVSNSRGIIKEIKLDTKFVKTKESSKYKYVLDTSDYKAGDYNMTAIVYYGSGKKTEARVLFRLGELYVGISNYTKEFEKGKIERMEIEVESFWNDNIKDVHAEVSILNYSISFLTPSMKLEPWKKRVLTGFFDTSSIKEDQFKANVTLYYEGVTTNKIVDLKFKKKINYTQYIIIGGVAFVILVLVITVVYLLIKVSKNKKSKWKRIIR